MDLIITCTVFGAFIMASFISGTIIGQKLSNKERITIPTPTEMVKRHVETKKYEAEKNRLEEIEKINYYNIDHYDGTGMGQKDFPE